MTETDLKKNSLVRLNLKLEEVMYSLGVPRYLTSKVPLRLSLSSFTSITPRTKPKHVDAQKQYQYLSALLAEPGQQHCFCIASDPTDRAAKYLAAYAMQRAYEALKPRHPKWIDIYGDIKADKEQVHPPSFLVLANVTASSTPFKFEKLRDTLERYSGIPRLVVTSGCDPMHLFVEKLHYPLTGCAYIKASSMKAIEIV